jgi:signal transduction histidine kinase
MPPKRSSRQNLQDLSALAEMLVGNEELPELYGKLTKRIAGMTGAKACLIAKYDKNSTTFIAELPPGISVSNREVVYQVNPERRKLWNFRKRGTLLSNNPATDRRLDSDFMKKYKVRNLIIAPMVVRKEVVGLVVLLNKKTPFTEFDAYLASLIAFQTGHIIINAHLREDEIHRAEQIQLLSEIISEIALIRDPQLILQTAVERIKQRFQYYFVAAGWVDPEAGVIQNVYSVPSAEALKGQHGFVLPVTNGLTGKAVRSGQTVMCSDVTNSPDYYPLLREVRSEIVAPVKIADSIVAVLDLESDRLNAFDESDRMIMETLAHALGTAIENANAFQSLEKINLQLGETSRMKDEIMQIVAHDFRSPLTVIRGYMDYLLRRQDYDDAQQKEIMETVSHQALRLQNLAEATLKASRIESGELAFDFEKTDFESFLNHLIFPWSERHSFIVRTGKNLPLVYTDPGRMQEVMENLLSNAIKYSPEGGKITIHVSPASAEDLPPDLFTDKVQSYLLVGVSDEGIGIPAEKRELLFRRFTRIHESKRIEGIGLGLYIAKKIVEAHGGRIWLKDQARGACFCFALPEYADGGRRGNILVVDDDIHTLRLVGSAISDLGYDVITASNGREAVDKLIRFSPALIVLDIIMPEINGEQLLERLAADQKTAAIPFIVFTGKPDYELRNSGSGRLIRKHEGIGMLLLEIKRILNLN